MGVLSESLGGEVCRGIVNNDVPPMCLATYMHIFESAMLRRLQEADSDKTCQRMHTYESNCTYNRCG